MVEIFTVMIDRVPGPVVVIVVLVVLAIVAERFRVETERRRRLLPPRTTRPRKPDDG